MNIPTVWAERRIDDSTVSYTSDTTFNGTKTVTATRTQVAGVDTIIWDDGDAVPHFLHERASRALKITA